jgi:ATP-dependent Clp protease ATP-binding subunit ClpA
MFERFTDRARRAIVLAQDAARAMGHAHIRPEHLLVGLREGEGMAADAMRQAGVDAPALRQRVTLAYESTPSATKVDKVPFSVEGKRSLEQALRAALALGHSYIGTEHLFLGVVRQADPADRRIDEVLGVESADVARRLADMVSGPSPSARSPALHAALDRARTEAGPSPLTTGHVLSAMVADPDSLVSRALSQLGVDTRQLQSAIDAVAVAETSDASPAPERVAITIGDTTTVIADAEVAAALQHLDADQLRSLIKQALDTPAAGGAAG